MTYCFVRFPGVPGSPGGVPGSPRVSSQKVRSRFGEGWRRLENVREGWRRLGVGRMQVSQGERGVHDLGHRLHHPTHLQGQSGKVHAPTVTSQPGSNWAYVCIAPTSSFVYILASYFFLPLFILSPTFSNLLRPSLTFSNIP